MYKKYLVFMLLLCNVLLQAQKNSIQNGGFENQLTAWNGTAAVINPWMYKSGKNSAAITTYDNKEWASIDQTFYLSKNTSNITISAWVKAAEIVQGKNDWNNGLVVVEFLGNGNKKLGNAENIYVVTGNTDWKYCNKKMVVPQGAKSCKIMLAMSYATGSLMVDDIEAIETTNEQETAMDYQASTVLNNGNFEKGLVGWEVGTTGIDISSAAHNGNNCLQITSTNNDWVGIAQSVNIADTKKSMVVAGWLKSTAINKGANSWDVGTCIISFFDNSNHQIGTAQNITTIEGTTNWTPFSTNITIPAGATKYKLMVAISHTNGTLFIDDIVVQSNN